MKPYSHIILTILATTLVWALILLASRESNLVVFVVDRDDYAFWSDIVIPVGLFAAAIITAVVIYLQAYSQISIMREQDINRQRREAESLLIRLPFHLSKIYELIDLELEYLSKLVAAGPAFMRSTQTSIKLTTADLTEMHNILSEKLSDTEKCIDIVAEYHAINPDSTLRIEYILNTLQVANSRLLPMLAKQKIGSDSVLLTLATIERLVVARDFMDPIFETARKENLILSNLEKKSVPDKVMKWLKFNASKDRKFQIVKDEFENKYK